MPLGTCRPAPPAVSILHGRWSPANYSDDSKNALATSITLSLLKEIITLKKCRKHEFNSQIKVSSALSNYSIQERPFHIVSKNRLYKYNGKYKFHYLCNFHHVRLLSKPDTILLLCCKACTGQGSSAILTSLTAKNVHVKSKNRITIT